MSQYTPGIYVKGDDKRVARSRSVAVALAFQGFRLQGSSKVEQRPAPKVPTATAKSAEPKGDEK